MSSSRYCAAASQPAAAAANERGAYFHFSTRSFDENLAGNGMGRERRIANTESSKDVANNRRLEEMAEYLPHFSKLKFARNPIAIGALQNLASFQEPSANFSRGDAATRRF